VASALKAAKSNFEEAIRKDPSFALAYAGLADTYFYLADQSQLAPDQAYMSANRH